MTDRDIKPENLAILATACLAAAESATPSPWKVDHLELSDQLFRSTMVSGPSTWVANTDVIAGRDLCEANAAYIALLANSTPQLARGYLEAAEQLEEREHAMHMRIRAGYDTTVADSWRAEVARVTAERDAARATLVDLQQQLVESEGDVDVLTTQLKQARRERDITTADLATARAEIERLKADAQAEAERFNTPIFDEMLLSIEAKRGPDGNPVLSSTDWDADEVSPNPNYVQGRNGWCANCGERPEHCECGPIVDWEQFLRDENLEPGTTPAALVRHLADVHRDLATARADAPLIASINAALVHDNNRMAAELEAARESLREACDLLAVEVSERRFVALEVDVAALRKKGGL